MQQNEQQSLFCDDAEYQAFVDKFKPKKTTDDCYTPPEIYDTILDWACAEYNIDPSQCVRPFWPGGDYERFNYPDGCVVLDNPPFSILTKICEFYLEREIPFFLFAPSLTPFSGRNVIMRTSHVICDADITYENGAIVRTSFITSFQNDVIARTAPELTRQINEKSIQLKRARVKKLPKYTYPYNVLTAAMLQRYSKYGIDFSVKKSECVPISKLDAQKMTGKAIYGGGLLLSERAAAERAAAERAAAERWELSDRERKIVDELSNQKED